MRVLMTADTVGGVWTYAVDLARSLAPHGVEVTLATMGATPSVAQLEQAASLDNFDLRPSNYKLEWMHEPWADVARAGDWLLELESEVRPDVVHLNGFAHAALPFAAPRVCVAHSCVLSWWRAVKGEEAPPSWHRYFSQVSAGLNVAESVVAPTQALLDEMAKIYGPLPRSRVIYNGRDASAYCPSKKEPFVLSAGRLWDEAKNVQTLAAAAGKLPWPVYVAGDDRHPDGARRPSDGVTCLGPLDEATLAGWFGRASIYALPARYEPFGLSALEAALSGCALVLGDIPTLREVWGDAAVYVPPDDAGALVAAIASLAADADARRALARRATQRASTYSAARMADDYLALYRSLAAETVHA